MLFKNYKKIRVVVHILVWAIYFSLMPLPSLFNAPPERIVYLFTHLAILMSCTYFNTVYLVGRYFARERYKAYLYRYILLFITGNVLVYLAAVIINYPPDPAKFFKFTLSSLMIFSMFFFLFSMYKIAKESYISSQSAKELQFEKAQAELSLLRSQLDAHFIFNTLNNLYLLVLNKSDKAPDAILKLSDMLSYTIYESHEKRLPITKEVDFIRNYISLQKLRIDEGQQVHFSADIQEVVHVEPLILFNFIENAFKYAGENVQVDGGSYHVYISINVNNGVLTMTVINGVADGYNISNGKSGVGLSNVRKRLELAYKDGYTLDILNDNQTYRVDLAISEL